MSAKERELHAAIDLYLSRAAAIEAAQPLQPEAKAAPLSGIDWHVEQWRLGVTGGIEGVPEGTAVRPEPRGDAVLVTIAVPAGHDALAVANTLSDWAYLRGNLGRYAIADAAHPRQAYLIRRGVLDTSLGWHFNAKTRAFFEDRGRARRDVFTVCGLTQTSKRTKAVRWPNVHEFGEDARGGTVELRLHPGQLLSQVQAAEAKLRQALECPYLAVDSVDGIHPIIRLNAKPIASNFPKENPLPPTLFVRPRSMVERHAAGDDFVIPLGVRADGTPLLINQAVAPHMGIFGSPGSGKTYLLTSIVRAACLQGAEVVLVDAKNGTDLRTIASLNLPGVVHYTVDTEAGLHRAVLYIRDEFERRKRLSENLQKRGVRYRAVPMLLVFDEAPAWIDDALSGGNREAKKSAEATIAHLSFIASQARERRCYLVTAGQYAYASAFSGKWKASTTTLVVLGPPSEINRQALFAAGEPRDQVKVLGAQIGKAMKGRGLVADVETGEIQLFQGFYNTPGSDAEVTFAADLAKTKRVRRFGWKFPRGDEPGGDGSWQAWTPATDPSSDSLPVIYLDGPDGNPIPENRVYDASSTAYSPGEKPLREEHTYLDSHD